MIKRLISLFKSNNNLSASNRPENKIRFKQLLKSADLSSNANDQYQVGSCYQNGDGIKINNKEAEKWYLRSANQGYMYGQHALGCLYCRESNSPEVIRSGIAWFEKAAQQGLPMSQCALGQYYLYGFGGAIEKDWPRAVMWIKAAVDDGDPCGFQLMGHMHQFGIGQPKDIDNAIYWYKKAAEIGDFASIQSLEMLRDTF